MDGFASDLAAFSSSFFPLASPQARLVCVTRDPALLSGPLSCFRAVYISLWCTPSRKRRARFCFFSSLVALKPALHQFGGVKRNCSQDL
jgi:hypothetical protein